ncbi:MAG TPA: helix-turn-helix transcriptional regulator [Ktedonosporobacter sp.]|jgi:transcriptional regulator with XRE-family HTH domain|nr:helix-turn-helix transcriptional regulator [Ktedonosporobacter sp.]
MGENEKQPNEQLRTERLRRGWSQKKVAFDIDTSKDVVSRWETGERAPSLYYQEKLCRLFGKTADELGFIQLGPNQSPTNITSMAEVDPPINERLDQAESITNLAWEMWFASRPKQATREITKLLPTLEKIIYMPLSTVHILHAKELVIRCHGLLGAIHLDALQNDFALYHYKQAYTLAKEIQDTNFTITYLALMGDVFRRQNDKTTAVSYMENARDQAANANQATLGYVLQLLAYTYSDISNETAFEQTISEATDLLAFAGAGRDIAKKEFIPFEIYEIRGKANRDLGKPLKAIPYLELAEKALSRAESMTPRWHALLEISRGQALCDAGDITTAVDVMSKGIIIAYQCHSPHQMNRVRKLLRDLENGPFQNHPRVKDLKNLLYETYMLLDNSTV